MLVSLALILSVISLSELEMIGKKVWKNECGHTEKGLTSWNEREDFPSLGIGHFIWYPKDKKGPFRETFPKLISYVKSKKSKVPSWINEREGAPWPTKQAFEKEFDSQEMRELRKWLMETIALQAAFMLERLETAASSYDSPYFTKLMETPQGKFALLDYLNFKGEGFSEKEKYQKEGWGLKQVLDNMKSNRDPLQEFVRSACEILERRVKNAPSDRQEAKWLKGWQNRVRSYLS